MALCILIFFFFSSRRRHTRYWRDWSSDVCSSDLRSRSTTGKPARQLRSAWTDEWADPANPDPLPMPLQPLLIADAQRRVARAAATNEGAGQLVNYFVGQVVGRMNQVKASRQVVMEIVEEFIDA